MIAMTSEQNKKRQKKKRKSIRNQRCHRRYDCDYDSAVRHRRSGDLSVIKVCAPGERRAEWKKKTASPATDRERERERPIGEGEWQIEIQPRKRTGLRGN